MRRKPGVPQRRFPKAWAAVAGLLAVVVLCARFGRLLREGLPMTQARTTTALQVQSSSFREGGFIPRQYTCDGANLSPNLSWSGVPAGARSLAVVMHDPDAAVDFTHWVAYDLEPRTRELAEGVPLPPSAAEGRNSFGRMGYGGPCPPPGKAHRYIFQVYALDARLDLPAGATRQQVETGIGRHLLAEGQLVGLYQR